MINRKPNFPGFWLPFVIASLVPSLGYAQDQGAPQPPQGSNGHNHQQYQQGGLVDNGVDNGDDGDAPQIPNKKGYLSDSSATSIFGSLKIATFPVGASPDGSTGTRPISATLTGIYPNACSADFEVRSSATNPDLTINGASATITGFAIYNNGGQVEGGLVACMAKHKQDCSGDDAEQNCSRISRRIRPISIDPNTTSQIGYLNKQPMSDDPSSPNWAIGRISSAKILSQAEVDNMHAVATAQAADAAETAAEKNVAMCISKGNVDAAQQLLGNITDSSARSNLMARIEQLGKAQDKKDLAALQARVKKAIASGKLEDAKAAEQDIYAFASAHADMQDQCAEQIKILADGIAADDVTDASAITEAKRMISDALSDDSGINMTQAKADELQSFADHVLPVREVHAGYARVEELQSQILAAEVAHKDPRGLLTQQQRELTNAQKLAGKDEVALAKEIKTMKCLDPKDPTGQTESKQASNDPDLEKACYAVADEIDKLKGEDSQLQTDVQQMTQAAVQKAQQAQGQNRTGQQQQANPLAALPSSFGPSTPTFGTNVPMYAGQVNGYSGGMPMTAQGNYGMGYQMTQVGMPMTQGYNPYNPYSVQAGAYTNTSLAGVFGGSQGI